MILTILLLALVSGNYAQEMVKWCTCAAIEPCKTKVFEAIVPCADKCKKHADNAGINYQVLRNCIMAYRPQIEATAQCSTTSFTNVCSKGPTNKMVPKRYENGIQISIMNEINNMIADNGATEHAAKYMGTVRKYSSCLLKCIHKDSIACKRKANCGLELPSDTAVAKTIKNCAVTNGVLTTPTVRSLCQCAVRAGATSLANICPRLIIRP
ncbi:hypothetical protein Tcan_17985 [Toxocara canis]|uniref:Uncharacterized protein n=1 Tax=Toxocara canis TaxID=6265 RepID=A0A0B2VZU5_TOXCA|nr:hypothetical protein Tcan_17985 [Toxocara canis]